MDDLEFAEQLPSQGSPVQNPLVCTISSLLRDPHILKATCCILLRSGLFLKPTTMYQVVSRRVCPIQAIAYPCREVGVSSKDQSLCLLLLMLTSPAPDF